MSVSNVFCQKVSNAKRRIFCESDFHFSSVSFHSNRVSLPCHRSDSGLQGRPPARSRTSCVQHIPHSPSPTADPCLWSVSIKAVTRAHQTFLAAIVHDEQTAPGTRSIRELQQHTSLPSTDTAKLSEPKSQQQNKHVA